MDAQQPESSLRSPTSVVKWIVLIMILIIAVFGIYQLFRSTSDVVTNTYTNNVNSGAGVTTGWTRYEAPRGISLMLPPAWQLIEGTDPGSELSETVGHRILTVQNFPTDLELHPKPSEIVIDFNLYSNSRSSLTDWLESYKATVRRDIYESVMVSPATVSGSEAITEYIITGAEPAVPVDTEWLDGTIKHTYIALGDEVLQVTSTVSGNSEELLATADTVIQTISR